MTIDDVVCFKIYLQSLSKAMANRKKRGEDGKTKT